MDNQTLVRYGDEKVLNKIWQNYKIYVWNPDLERFDMKICSQFWKIDELTKLMILEFGTTSE